MRNLKLRLEYDGTDFHGFQRQGRLRTVQGVLEERFSKLLGEPISIIGAGRTDAGVHAAGQVVNFKTTRPLPIEKTVAVLNKALPGDVKVQHAEEAGAEFHARRSARSRTYEYVIIERATPSPLLGRYALLLPERVDLSLLEDTAGRLRGRHDFRAFQGGGAETKTTERTLLRLDASRTGDRVTVTAQAEAFLYQMVRRLVGALLSVSRGELSPEQVEQALHAGERGPLLAPAPACGLCLVTVSYELEGAGAPEMGEADRP